VIQGQNVFIGTAGTPLALSGRSIDPGRDDLTLSWDYGDGAPSPDITHTFPVPHDITDTESHTFTSQCTFGVTFTSVDDDNASASDHALVMVEASQRSISHLAGWWQHELGRQGEVVIPTDKLECLLAMVDLVSAVFHEHRDASTIPAAFDVMFMGGNQGSAQQKLDRELLMAWLNFANGTWGFNEMLDTNGDGTNDMTFAAFVGTFEAVRLNAASTDTDLRAATARLHQLNVARVGSYGPEEYLLPEDVPAGDPGPLYSPNNTPPDAPIAGARPAVQAAPATVKTFDGMRVQLAPGLLRISFAQANAGPIRLRIFDLSGRSIRTFEGDRGAGVSTIVWDAGAESVSPGVYFLQLESEGKLYRSKAALLR
jgi:hypothetical protein